MVRASDVVILGTSQKSWRDITTHSHTSHIIPGFEWGPMLVKPPGQLPSVPID